MIKMNKYQTVFTEEDFKNLPREIRSEYYEALSTIKFVKWLIEPEEVRGFAKNRKRWDNPNDLEYRKEDPNGRIWVDLSKPHILEDLDFFRERALFFNKYKKYTGIPPNPNPKSAYAAFWREELRRWRYGLVRPSDGEWIPGGLYFYWNYSPIWLTKSDDKAKRKGKSRGTRIRAFPHPWLGDYLFYHYKEQARDNGQHGKVLKARGMGISFKMGSESPRNMYVYPGSGNPNFHLASDKTFLTGDKGVFGKAIDTLDWVAEHTPLPKLRLTDSKQKMEIQLGYLDEYGGRKGLLSSVYGISLKDNPDKARGIRGPLIHYEEDGLFPHLEDAWNINRKAVEDGDTVYGIMLALGTGGVEGSDFAGSEKLFYNPSVYNIYGIPNVFDKNANGESLCGFFWGSYLNRNGCYDLNTGEPDVTKAIFDILQDRYLVKKGAADARAITQKKAEEPLTPQDSIMRVEGSIFPISDLKDWLADITPNIQRFISPHYVGTLNVNSSGEVDINVSENCYPIREYPAIDNKLGAVEIFELPSKVTDPFRYILGTDTYDDDDVSYSDSLGSVFVFDRWTRRIVAEYTGRPQTANEFYEIVYRLALFYNGTIMYENNKKGLYAYFANVKKALHLLADTPKIITDKQVFKARSEMSNTSKGINATTALNAYGRRLQADWQVEEAYDESNKNVAMDEEAEKPPFIPNLRKIRSIGYIKECIAWNSDINTDRVSAMNMVMIYDIELTEYGTNKSRERVKTLADDPFFNRFGKNVEKTSLAMKGWNI